MKFNRRQKIILTIYFIIGFPMLPLVPMILLIRRYIVEDKEVFKPENRERLIAETLSFMVVYMLIVGAVLLAMRCPN